MNSKPTPLSEGFRMPAEWEKQAAVWMSWPVEERLWPGKMAMMHGIFARLAAAMSRFQEVCINACETHHDAIEKELNAAGGDGYSITLFPHPTNDVWCRDHGPTFVKNQISNEIAVVDWVFNAWGGKFEPHDLDNSVPVAIAESLGLRIFSSELTFEGGGLEVDGCGRVLTTESVLLNSNRNPNWDRAAAERELREFLGCEEVLWLPSGLQGDDTDGHIDTLTRFFSPASVLTAVETNPADPNHIILAQNRAILKNLGLTVVDLPQPDPIAAPSGWREERLPGTYANFLLLNDAVLVPTYRQPAADDRAIGIIGDCFPGRKAVGFDCYDILLEGGAIHCLTQQQPA